MARKAKTENIKSKIVNKIRSVWRYSNLRKQIRKRCEVDQHYYLELPRKIKGKIKTIKVKFSYYRCEKCRKLTDHVDIDHKIPAVDPVLGWQGYDIFIERLFCNSDNLWGLCLICHGKKTTKENSKRKSSKKKISLDKESEE